ncbi:MAG: hypothetical protein DMF06_11655 [Verrucomicrobia bacterium]|nr:MAG: hypothetical protein DMF06_11655 [Verrucomicrobiota bacterium]
MGKGVGIGDGVAGGVGVGTGGVGLGLADALHALGPRIATLTGAPVLKKPIVALVATGGLSESKRKLYSVPHLMAFAF